MQFNEFRKIMHSKLAVEMRRRGDEGYEEEEEEKDMRMT